MSLSKICLHWTAGSNFPCDVDLKAYHFCIDKNGLIYKGFYKPEDNINCNDGRYAQHLGGGNTGAIGIAVCAMAGFNLSKKITKYPIVQKQIEALCCLAAFLSIKYDIHINAKNVFTHYEFDLKQPKNKRKGKIDITYISYFPELSKENVGNYLRQKISWYKEKIKSGNYELKKKGNCYEFTYLPKRLETF
ncbi:N-acetylmuramoyl-L-alanine amidase [bacterium]|nr:N-acetylmuramoyl-L-alanine amidase [bacterium]MBQ9149470.1 N-acetylmuramoyl-L-alanine amidase [bacterium]